MKTVDAVPPRPRNVITWSAATGANVAEYWSPAIRASIDDPSVLAYPTLQEEVITYLKVLHAT